MKCSCVRIIPIANDSLREVDGIRNPELLHSRMAINKQQRMAFAALGVATLGLIADKTVLSPQEASADETVLSSASQGTSAPAKSPVSPESMSANLHLVSDWARRNLEEPVRDPFEWDERVAAAPIVNPSVTLADAAQDWVLSAIMGTEGRMLAVINQEPLRLNEFMSFPGDENRQAKVIEIKQRFVVLYENDQTVRLRLPAANLSDEALSGL